MRKVLLLALISLLYNSYNKAYSQNQVPEFLKKLNIEKDSFNLIFYNDDHSDSTTERFAFNLLLKCLSDENVNFYFETNDYESELFKKDVLSDNNKYLPTYFINFFGALEDHSYWNEIVNKIQKSNLNLIGIDCINPLKPSLKIIIDSTVKELRSLNLKEEKLLQVSDLLDIAPGLNNNLSFLHEDEFKRLDTSLTYLIQNLKSKFLIDAWSNMLNFFKWCSIRGYLVEAKTTSDCNKTPKWFAYRDSMMAVYFNQFFDTTSKRNIYYTGASHCFRRGINYESFDQKSFSKSISDFEKDRFKNFTKVLITTDKSVLKNKNIDLLEINRFELFGRKIILVQPKFKSYKDVIYFKLNLFCKEDIVANWFNAFDYVALIEK